MRMTMLLAAVALQSSCQCGAPAGGDGGVGGGSGATGGGSASAGGGSAGAGGGASSLDGGLADFCASNGPVPVQVGGAATCTGDLGKRAFRFAFCSCSAVTASNSFTIGAIAGGRDGGGSLGVNGAFSSSNLSTINGTLWAGGAVSSNNQLHVGRDLACASASVSMGSVQRDARVAGNFVSGNSYTVGGTIHVPPAATVTNVSGAVVREAVVVAEPCDCAAPLDVPAIVQFFKTVSDDAARGVSPAALTGTSPVDLTLECGRYTFQGANAVNGLKVRTRGRVVIAIEGDVLASNGFDLQPEAGSQLDLFIGGNLTFSNTVTLGDATRPWATRVYVGGTQVSTSNQFSVSANLYAPRANFEASNKVDMQGALFVESLSASNSFTVKYDDAILNLDGCAAADAGCTSCGGCANPTPACGASGTCSKCQADSDCCAPLSCDATSGLCLEGILN